MRREPLGDMSGPLIHLFSDYGGTHKGSMYETTAFLYMDTSGSEKWQAERLRVRQRYLPDGSRISFKGLNDINKRQALIPSLEAADMVPGVLLVVAVHKSLTNLCWSKDLRQHLPAAEKFHHKWSTRSFERAVFVSHMAGLMAGGLCMPGQEIHWYSDEDELFANSTAAADVGRLFATFSSRYAVQTLKPLCVGTSAIDEGDRYEEDHIAISDLAAGAAAEMLTEISKYSGRIPSRVAFEFPGKLSLKTDVLSTWLSYSGDSLKKVLMVFDSDGKARYRLSRLNWQ